jgi:hypothetical protein
MLTFKPTLASIRNLHMDMNRSLVIQLYSLGKRILKPLKH